REVLVVDKVVLRVYPFGVLLLVFLWQRAPQLGGLFIAAGNDVERKLDILEPDHGVRRNVLQQRDVSLGKEFGLHVGHDGYRVDVAYRKLAFNVKGADAFDVVTEKLDAIGQVGGEGKYIHDSPADGVLSGLIDKVYPFKLVLLQEFVDEVDIEVGALRDFERVLL